MMDDIRMTFEKSRIMLLHWSIHAYPVNTDTHYI